MKFVVRHWTRNLKDLSKADVRLSKSNVRIEHKLVLKIIPVYLERLYQYIWKEKMIFPYCFYLALVKFSMSFMFSLQIQLLV